MAKKQYMTVTGLKEIDKRLKQLPEALGKKVMRKVFRKNAKPIQEKVIANLRSMDLIDSGRLKKAVKLKAGKRSKVSLSFLVIISSKLFPESFYATFIEYGAPGQNIPAHAPMRKALDELRDQVTDSLKKDILQALDEEIKALGGT